MSLLIQIDPYFLSLVLCVSWVEAGWSSQDDWPEKLRPRSPPNMYPRGPVTYYKPLSNLQLIKNFQRYNILQTPKGHLNYHFINNSKKNHSQFPNRLIEWSFQARHQVPSAWNVKIDLADELQSYQLEKNSHINQSMMIETPKQTDLTLNSRFIDKSPTAEYCW